MSCAVLCSLHSSMTGISHLLSGLKHSVEPCIACFRIKIIYMFSRHFIHAYVFVRLSQSTKIILLNNISKLVFKVETSCVLCEGETQY